LGPGAFAGRLLLAEATDVSPGATEADEVVLDFSEAATAGFLGRLAPLAPEVLVPGTLAVTGPKGNWIFLSEDELTTIGVVSATRLHVIVEAAKGLSELFGLANICL
jgi:hypothetical protein